MSSDDKERTKRAEREDRALALARRRTAPRPAASKSSRWLALVPVFVAGLFFALLMPRATRPSDIPLPRLDLRALAAVEAADRDRAAKAQSTRLPGDVLAVGTALTEMNAALDAGDDETRQTARLALDAALRTLYARPDHGPDLVALRATQLEGFVREVLRFEATGEESVELRKLGGPFLARMRAVGWVTGKNHVEFDEHALRVAYKIVWNSLTVGESPREPGLAITLDEQRALYILYLVNPHPSEATLPGLGAELAAATTPKACERARVGVARESELWRAEKIRRLGQIDPTYPTAYALGVAFFRAGRFEESTQAFRTYVERHPDGPYALRARNHLKASLTEMRF